eukprot:Skav224805  [mRNA]  locus=scaffold764:685164:687637:- [translate_table: standard]
MVSPAWVPGTRPNLCRSQTRSTAYWKSDLRAMGFETVGSLVVWLPTGNRKQDVYEWTEWQGCSGECLGIEINTVSRYPMQRFRARKVVEPPKGEFTMEATPLMETSLCDKDGHQG